MTSPSDPNDREIILRRSSRSSRQHGPALPPATRGAQAIAARLSEIHPTEARLTPFVERARSSVRIAPAQRLRDAAAVASNSAFESHPQAEERFGSLSESSPARLTADPFRPMPPTPTSTRDPIPSPASVTTAPRSSPSPRVEDFETPPRPRPDGPMDSAAESRAASAAFGQPQALSHHYRNLLEPLIGARPPDVRIYANPQSESFLRSIGAEAARSDDALFFADRSYPPRRSEDLALLGHELSHAARDSSTPTESSAISAAEREAMRVESQIDRRYGDVVASHALAPAPSAFANSTGPAPASATPMSLAPSPAPAPAAPSVQMARPDRDRPDPAPREADAWKSRIDHAEWQRLKDEMYRDLVRRIRTEFERGA